MCNSHIEILDGLSHIDFIYGVDNDGGRCEKGEQKEKEEVEHHVTHEPGKTSH